MFLIIAFEKQPNNVHKTLPLLIWIFVAKWRATRMIRNKWQQFNFPRFILAGGKKYYHTSFLNYCDRKLLHKAIRNRSHSVSYHMRCIVCVALKQYLMSTVYGSRRVCVCVCRCDNFGSQIKWLSHAKILQMMRINFE